MPEQSGPQGQVLTGPDWSHWPERVLGAADPTTIGYRVGTYRIIPPDETWLAVQPALDRAGITRVADLTWLDDLGIPTVQAVRPASLTLSVSQGKAMTYRGAQVSAVMESLENWHVENVAADLESVAAKDLAAALTYDPAQLCRPPGSLYHPDAKLDWMVATTLLTGRQSWVPWTSVLVNIAIADCWSPPMFKMDTNGLASGNSYDEATLHGLYELMERSAMAMAGRAAPIYELSDDDWEGANCAHLIKIAHAAGSQFHIARVDAWDDYFCFAAELTSPMLEVPFDGFGFHHDPNVSLARAITEAAQSRLTAISGAREDLPSALYQRFGRLHGYSPAARSVRQTPRAEAVSWQVPDAAALPELVALAATAVATQSGVEPLAVVCDFPDACVPVVKVLAPGLPVSIASPMRIPPEESA